MNLPNGKFLTDFVHLQYNDAHLNRREYCSTSDSFTKHDARYRQQSGSIDNLIGKRLSICR